MAKQIKKAFCVVLAVIMALTCFTVSVMAYSGYDHDGTNTSLKVQSVVKADKTSYNIGDTVTATITLNHPDNDVIGWKGAIAFDSQVLEYKSATVGDGFAYYSTIFEPVATETAVSSLTAGRNGASYDMASLCRLIGANTFTKLSLIPVTVISNGVEAGNDHTVITLTFEAKANVSATNISLLPSYVYSSAYGYYDCAASAKEVGDDDSVSYITAYSAIRATTAFAITDGGSGGDTFYQITFQWHGGSETISVKEGDVPAYPAPADYTSDDDDYNHTFKEWTPALVAATATATYIADYNDVWVDASYINYNSVKEAAIAKRGDGSAWTPESVAVLDAALAVDVSGLGKGHQSQVDAAQIDIQNAADNLVEKQAVSYDITFVVNGNPVVVPTTENTRPQAPAVQGYSDNEKNYTFSKWKDNETGIEYTSAELPVATKAATYTAQYSGTFIEYPVTFTWNGGSTVVNTHWGVAPVAPTNIPSYEAGGKTYSHNGWNPAVAAYDGTVTSYEATYSSEAIIYNIIFVVNGEETTVPTAAGTMPQAPAVSGYSEGDYDYTPDGWNPALAPASANGTTYTAKFTETFVPADYTSVNAAITEAGKVNRDIYTDESLAALDDAIAAADVENPLGRTQQSAVNSYAADILDAIDNLKYKPADYTAYNTAKANLETELAKTDAYTPDSIAAVTAALADIDNGLDKTLEIINQDTVNQAEAAVNALFAQLVQKADKSSLKSLIDQAEALNPDLYVDFSGVTAALTEANRVYNDGNATDQEVIDAKNALNTELGKLQFKPADYSAWEAIVNRYNNIDTDYYTPESVAEVEAVIAQIKENQDINYQDELNALAAQLEAKVNSLELITKWQGEADWEGVDHPYFGSNLEFVQKVNPDDASDIEIEVYLNHPSYDVSMLQIAALYDYSAMRFVSAEIKNGTEIYDETKAAAFNPADYSLKAMANPYILKIAADYDPALSVTNASKDLVMVLKFRATGQSATSYIKAVPLASNTTPDKSVFSQALTSAGAKEFMHNDAANLVLAEGAGGSITGTFVSKYNNTAEVKIALYDGDNEVDSVVATGANPDYSFAGVADGTYTIKMSAVGSLGFTVNNVVVKSGENTSVPSVSLLFGDYDGNGVIATTDFSNIITAYSTNTYEAAADVDGNGVITTSDINYAISHYNKLDTEQVITL